METWLPALRWNGLISMRISPSGVMYVAEYRRRRRRRVPGRLRRRQPPARRGRQRRRRLGPGAARGPLLLGRARPIPRCDPLTFAWDFDGDGTADSTEANPTYTYDRAGHVHRQAHGQRRRQRRSRHRRHHRRQHPPAGHASSRPPRGAFVSLGREGGLHHHRRGRRGCRRLLRHRRGDAGARPRPAPARRHARSSAAPAPSPPRPA